MDSYISPLSGFNFTPVTTAIWQINPKFYASNSNHFIIFFINIKYIYLHHIYYSGHFSESYEFDYGTQWRIDLSGRSNDQCGYKISLYHENLRIVRKLTWQLAAFRANVPKNQLKAECIFWSSLKSQCDIISTTCYWVFFFHLFLLVGGYLLLVFKKCHMAGQSTVKKWEFSSISWCGKWLGHIGEEHVKWKILLWSLLENTICHNFLFYLSIPLVILSGQVWK